MKRQFPADRADNDRAPGRQAGDNRGSEGNVYKRLKVHPASRFSGSFPFFREPKEIGTFSQDDNRVFWHNEQQLRYFIPPQDFNHVDFNLRLGYKEAILRDDSIKEYLNDLLRWVSLNKHCFNVPSSDASSPSPSLNTDFLCWRGLLTKLLCSPYESREGWMIAVILHKGTYYMCEFETEQKKQMKVSQTEKEKEMSYWGYKFEQYLTSDKVDGTPDIVKPVNTNEGYGSVVRSRLKDHSLVYGGEVDCCEKTKNGKKYIELKTSRELYRPNNERNFKRFKLIKWWAQSFLLGLPKIIAGFRDDEGVVRRLQTFETLQIPRLIRDLRDPWDPTVCFNFLDEFLKFVKDSVKDDNPRIVHLIEWMPGEAVTLKKLSAGSDYSFLPEWYINGTQPP